MTPFTCSRTPSPRPVAPIPAKFVRPCWPAVKGYKGVEGTYNFDANGDGLHGYNIVKNSNGDIIVEQRIDFND
jgi:hypothetical protein